MMRVITYRGPEPKPAPPPALPPVQLTRPRVTVAAIVARVAWDTGVQPIEITGDRRCKRLVRVRWAAIKVAALLTPHSLVALGRLFGGRDHATIIHALKRADELMARDPAFAPLVARTITHFTEIEHDETRL